ncbi:hypothetical protein R3P38DRAFT_2788920 [Favolaschia claudopus]|uniref:DNA 3'-5' helicase n=1 Tax=Favolaschia claudopus TaxID=2862362 RepID=A0AAW0AKC5_9AGAR
MTKIIHLNDTGDWVTTPALRAAGLSVNTELGLVICLEHNNAYTLDNYSQHISRKHAQPKLGPVEQDLTHFHISNDYPDLHTHSEARPIIPGLPVTEGQFGCPDCPYSGNSKTVNRHCRDEKHGGGGGNNVISGLCTQILNNGIARSCYRVLPQPATTTLPPSGAQDELLSEILEFEVPAQAEIPNARQISTWLMGNQWHKEIEPYREHVSELCTLVAMPKPEEFEGLATSIKHYYYNATDLIKDTELLILRMINSHDIDTGAVNHTPLHEHHQGNTTLNQYLVPITHFLAALMRHSPHYSFPTTPQLADAVAGLHDEISHNSLHDVFMALWKAQWLATGAAKTADPTMKFLCLFRLKPDGSFHTAKDTTRPITQLCRCIQLALLTEIHALVDSGEAASQMDAWKMVAPFVKDNELTSFANLITLQHFATSQAMKGMSMPHINWLDRKKWTKLQFDGNPISLGQITEIVGRLEDKIKKLWEEEIMFGLGLRVPYGDLQDDLLNKTPGYSFIQDARNPFLAHKNTLVRQIFADEKLRNRFVTLKPGAKQALLNILEARKWLVSLATVEGLIMLAAELSDGGVIRGTELASMLARNTPFANRNLAGLGKFVALVRQYDKTSNNTQSDKLVPLAMSSFLADLIVQLHTLARPLAQFFASVIWPSDVTVQQNYRCMLFMNIGREFVSDNISELMAINSLPILDWGLTLWSHRHINIAFRKKHCTSILDTDDTHVTLNALSNGHSAQTEKRIYGISPDAWAGVPEEAFNLYLENSTLWQQTIRIVPGGMGLSYTEAHHSRFHALVTPEPEDELGMQAMLQAQTQMLRQVLEASQQLQAKVDSLEKTVAKLTHQSKWFFFDLTDMKQLYAPLLEAVVRLSDDELSMDGISNDEDDNAETSQDKKAIAVPPPVTKSSVHEKDMSDIVSFPLEVTPPPFKPVLRKATQPQWPSHPVASTSRAVLPPQQKPSPPVLYGAKATWKSHQQYEAVKHILALKSDVIVTLPTGGGKTLIVVLCSMVEKGYSVIVLPLLSVIEDWERRLDMMGVGYERFGSGDTELHGKHNLILVTSDMARTSRWDTAIGKLNQSRPVLRYVLDEGHYYATDDVFRAKAFSNPFQLRKFPIQIVILSATIPELMRKFLVDAFELSNPVHVAGSVHRRELTLSINTSFGSFVKQLEKAEAIIEREISSELFASSDASRYLVFVSTVEAGKQAAKTLALPLYHANSEKLPITDEERQNMYSEWISGVHLGLVCTTALSAGNDYAHVRFTIHLDVPHDWVLSNQQMGRACRDGLPGTNYILANSMPFFAKSKKSKDKQRDYGDLTGQQAWKDVLYPPKGQTYPESCHTYQETALFDGDAQTCSENAENAPVVRKTEQPDQLDFSMLVAPDEPHTLKRKLEASFQDSTDRARKRSAKMLETSMGDKAAFRSMMDALGNVCGCCVVNKTERLTAHAFDQCPNVINQGRFKAMKAAIKYPKPASSGGDYLHPPFAKGNLGCTHPHLLLGVAFGVLHDGGYRKAAERHFKSLDGGCLNERTEANGGA